MRIAFISYEYPPDSASGGIATYIFQASRMLRNRGHDVEIFAATHGQTRTVVVDGITEHWIGERNRMNFAVPAGHFFANRHREKPFDILEGPDYNADARFAQILVPDVPLVVKMHTPTILVEKLNRPLSKRNFVRLQYQNAKQLFRSIFSGTVPAPWYWDHFRIESILNDIERNHAESADLVCAPCKSLCDFAQNYWKLDSSKIKHLPYPYRPNTEMLAIEQKFDSNAVGFIGRLETRKGIETLVSSIPRVLQLAPNTTFHFFGSPCIRHASSTPYDTWLSEQLKHFSKNIEIHGKLPLDKIALAYRSVGICVFPSYWENFPNVCLEAMASARAIIASNQGGMKDMLEPDADGNPCGVLIAPKNSTRLSEEIIKLLRNPHERLRLGERARKKILNAYNDEVIGSLTESIYSEAILLKRAKASRT